MLKVRAPNVAIGLCLVCGLGLAACSGPRPSSSDSSRTAHTQGTSRVALTVHLQPLGESKGVIVPRLGEPGAQRPPISLVFDGGYGNEETIKSTDPIGTLFIRNSTSSPLSFSGQIAAYQVASPGSDVASGPTYSENFSFSIPASYQDSSTVPWPSNLRADGKVPPGHYFVRYAVQSSGSAETSSGQASFLVASS